MMDSTPLFILLLATFILLIREHRQKKKILADLAFYKSKKAQELMGKGKLSELRIMAAGIAHEISNPLMVISGHVQRIKKKHPGDNSDLSVEKIELSAERISKIIQGLRSYIYRTDDDTESFIPLKEMMEEVLLFCGQRLKNHGVGLRLLNLDGLFVRGHRGQFEQAILNLINNSLDAIDHAPEKWIEIYAEKMHDKVYLYFRDSGKGIPEDVQKKMMEPFFSTKAGKSTGLGLPLVKSIAEKFGGDLIYLNDEGNTTFRLELPRAPLAGITPTKISGADSPATQH